MRFTPEALHNSNFRKMTLSEMLETDFDEIFVFDYPSPSPIDQENGDGVLLEVWDYSYKLDSINVEGVNRPATPETEIYVR